MVVCLINEEYHIIKSVYNFAQTSPRGESSITIDPVDETRVIEEQVKEKESTHSHQSTSRYVSVLCCIVY